ncbi:cell division protein ZapE [Gordonia humi]
MERARVSSMTPTPQQRCAAELLGSDAHVYLFGPPGTGKTRVVDWFVEAAAASGHAVLRRHLHRFFVDLHRAIGDHGGWEAGVDAVLTGPGGRYGTVCLDEFTVHDPGDGVFLDRVLRTVSARGVRMVLTSNRAPKALMPNPLFHAGFEPTIARIESMFTVRTVAGEDLRRGRDDGMAGFRAGVWTVGRPAGPPGPARVVTPGSRPIALTPVGDGARIDFTELCARPTNAADYLWLAAEFSRVQIVGVRGDVGAASLSRWATLLDVLHDADLRVDVWSPSTRAEMAASLTEVLPDAARAISRMGAWCEITPGAR